MRWLWNVLSSSFPYQDLIFDLGDPVRWEYLLLGTDKSHLSLTEEEDDGMNDDDDVENLVGLSSMGLGGGMRDLYPVLPQANLTNVLTLCM